MDSDIENKHIIRLCEECDKEAAVCALSFNIIKRYPLDAEGDPLWGDGDIVQNDDESVFLCDDCANDY